MSATPGIRITTIWSVYLSGKRFDGAQFTSAIDFFETVTGLEAHDNKSYVGRLPIEHLESDLRAWDECLRDNADCLRWNPSRSSVERVPPHPSVTPAEGQERSSHHDV